MRAIIQRVQNASVVVNEKQISSIGKGLCVLIGISSKDDTSDLEYIVKKILNMRLFDDPDGTPWKRSVVDEKLEVLCVSQFTLYGNCQKGNKPDFHASMKADQAREMYTQIIGKLKSMYLPEKIQDGEFQSKMEVNLVNQGPVTLIIDSDKNSRK
ncbi:D-tyrosyl-tRNA(Tyr) deacylase [Coelomomyces lativittatus]|nr:D-tyrosyl-tRNA(Tyr) deacylase [Coelomomyces lativittatus]KAJ1517601.1 D-tyrosyl-tRNA(Tyr) deacylase [Coelomomyces lativittatus]